MKQIHILLLVLILIPSVYSLGIQGQALKTIIEYEPGKEYSYDYFLINNDLDEFSYIIIPQTYNSQVNLDEYVTITPTEYTDVKPGETRPFNVKITLPENLASPGDNEIRVWVKSKAPPSGRALTGVPNVGIRYMFFVLYPWKTVGWGVSLPPINVGDKEDFKVNVRNLGEPMIGSVKAYIDVYDSQDNLLQNLETDTERNLLSKETKDIYATFDSSGLPAGEYQADVKLYWDQNISIKEYDFTIGRKNVKIINFTRLFEFGEINKMDIDIVNEWNDPIDKIYAKVEIYDKDGVTRLKNFKSLESSLDRLKRGKLEAYFDTDGFDKGEYLAKIELVYEGAKTFGEGTIKIDENINGVVVEEIPGTFKLSDLFAKIPVVSVLTFFLVVFILISLYLILHSYIPSKKKPEEKVVHDIDGTVVKRVKKLKAKYTDDYIKKLLLKEGWSKDKVELIFIKHFDISEGSGEDLEKIDQAVIDMVKELREKYKDDYINDMMIAKGWSKHKIEEILKRLK